jgi:hypothetical protein
MHPNVSKAKLDIAMFKKMHVFSHMTYDILGKERCVSSKVLLQTERN